MSDDDKPTTSATEDEDTEAQNLTADTDGADEGDPDGADQLGEPGKKALASMKDKWKAERDRRKQLEQELAGKQQTADGDGKPDADAIRRQAEQEATARANARVIRSEVRAAAAGKLADPKDALKFLDLDQFEVGADGDVDADEISEAIDDLIQSKPYLAAATAKRFQGTAESGARKGRTRPSQLTQADLKSMTPEAIDKAREAGQLDDLMGGK